MKEKIYEIFEALKKLDIKATPGNVSIMNGVFVYLKDIYTELENKERGEGNECEKSGLE